MGDPTFTRKVYICSRQAAPSSRSTSDFDITLSRNLVLPQKCAGFITDIQIPHSWYAVDAGHRFLYFVIQTVSATGNVYGKIELLQGNYTGKQLADAIRPLMATKLASLTGAPAGMRFYVEYASSLHKLRYALSPAYDFAGVWTDSVADTYTSAADSVVTPAF